MKKGYFVFFVLFSAVVSIEGCKSVSDEFREDAARTFKSKKHLDKEDYERLTGYIKSDKRAFPRFVLTGDSIDHAAVHKYLVTFLKQQNPDITDAAIWQPGTVESVASKFNINVFVENSASIDGYVGDARSTFKNTVFKMLVDLKNLPLADSLNLNYINTKPISIKVSAASDDIKAFYQRLNPESFRNAGGARGSTDVEQMLKQLLDKTDERNLSVFISDCVFSPGHADAKQYLAGQFAAIYNDFIAARKTNPGLSVIVLQCSALFNGTYYDYRDMPHPNINADRPYYMWFIGSADQIKHLVDNRLFDLIKNGYSNKLVIQGIASVNKPRYKILPRPVCGSFSREGLPQSVISDAKADDGMRKGLFCFDVAVDFSQSLQDAAFFLDSSNYVLGNRQYHLTAEQVKDPADPATAGFTHILHLKTAALQNELLQIDVVGKTPAWVMAATSADDSHIEADSTEMHKTFGFYSLVSGVCDAFFPKSSANSISTIGITIKK